MNNLLNFSFTQIIREMFTLVEKSQVTKMRVDMANAHAQLLDKRPLRHQMSTDNMNAPPFNIPNLRVEQRKTSSAEDMARKNSTGHLLILLYPSFACQLPTEIISKSIDFLVDPNNSTHFPRVGEMCFMHYARNKMILVDDIDITKCSKCTGAQVLPRLPLPSPAPAADPACSARGGSAPVPPHRTATTSCAWPAPSPTAACPTTR